MFNMLFRRKKIVVDCLHEWSKWQQLEWVPNRFLNGGLAPFQQRHCMKCGFIEKVKI